MPSSPIAEIFPGAKTLTEGKMTGKSSDNKGFFSEMQTLASQLEDAESLDSLENSLSPEMKEMLQQLEQAGIDLPQAAKDLRALLQSQDTTTITPGAIASELAQVADHDPSQAGAVPITMLDGSANPLRPDQRHVPMDGDAEGVKGQFAKQSNSILDQIQARNNLVNGQTADENRLMAPGLRNIALEKSSGHAAPIDSIGKGLAMGDDPLPDTDLDYQSLFRDFVLEKSSGRANPFGGNLSGQAAAQIPGDLGAPRAVAGGLAHFPHLSTAANRTGDPQFVIPQQVTDPAWKDGLADKVVWMLGRNQMSAELRLNPANLGPMEIKLSMDQDQASISFLTQHAAVKEAIDQAIPRLREMLDQQNIDLMDVNVDTREGSQETAEQTAQNDQAAGLFSDVDPEADDLSDAGTVIVTEAPDSVVDLFA